MGGSFDPITLGHAMVAQIVYAEVPVDEFWFMPCNNHQYSKNLSPASKRWYMCATVAAELGIPYLACDFEIRGDRDGKLYDTLHAMLENKENSIEYRDIEIYPVVGMDCANDIPTKWYRGQDLIKEFPFIVVGRGGTPSETDWFRQKPHTLLDLNWTCSSTAIREAASRGEWGYVNRRTHPSIWNTLKETYAAWAKQ